MLALTTAGSVGTRPVLGGVAGLLAGSVVAGYWQLEPSVAGGLNGGSVRSTGGAGVAVYSGYVGYRSMFSRLRARITKNSTLSTITRTVSAVIT